MGANADSDRGAFWVLFLNPDGSVRESRKVGDATGGFGGALDDFDHFGHSLAALGDLDGDGAQDLATGADTDDDGGADRGAVWVLFLDAVPFVCGNDVIDPVEECDDGGSVAGDGCNAACELEDFFRLYGEAEGGSVGITVDGVMLGVATTAGQSAADVLAALAAEVNADATLMAAGTTAFVQGNRLVTNGIVTGESIADDGLSATAAAPVPLAPGWGMPLLAALLLLGASRALARMRG